MYLEFSTRQIHLCLICESSICLFSVLLVFEILRNFSEVYFLEIVLIIIYYGDSKGGGEWRERVEWKVLVRYELGEYRRPR